MVDTIGLILIRSGLLVVILMSVFAGMTLIERKVLGYFQLRVGPTRTGPWGVLQPVADGVKFLVKEDIIPRDADRLVFRLAPIISLFTALAAWSVIPVGPAVEVFGRTVPLSIADPPGGVLVVIAFTAVHIYGVSLAGWASQSKYSLLGSLRSAAQVISYELTMAMSLLGVLLLAGTLSLTEIVEAQQSISYVWLQPLGFVLFFLSGAAQAARVPFDLPEADTELVAGYNTEYSGMRYALFAMAEYITLITVSSLVILLYLGGWNGPAWLPPVGWFVVKLAVLLFIFIWMRATLPRMRYDRLMDFGWKLMLPLSLLNLVVTAVGVAIWG